MRELYKLIMGGLLIGLLASAGAAQRPRSVSTSPASDNQAASAQPTATPEPAPQTVRAKYEGGVFGYDKQQEGTLTFDDVNHRLLFRDKNQKDVLFIPYNAVTSAFADTKARRPAAASVLGSVPLPYGANLAALLFKKKVRYLTLQFQDQDTHMAGVTSFRMDNQEVLASVLNTLAGKSQLTPRGEVFVKRKEPDQSSEQSGTGSTGSGSAPFMAGVINNRATSLPQPDYPQEARDAKVQGDVSVRVTVDEQGNVTDAQAINGPPLLQPAAIEAARRAKITPMRVDGRPVPFTGLLTYKFIL